jgi:hypothetical protein
MPRRQSRKIRRKAILVLLPLLLAMVPAQAEERTVVSSPLQNLASLEQFQEIFNRDQGVPRVVLLVSPT